jgi:hypothetical protein
MEEVDGSNPSRSTTTFQTLGALLTGKSHRMESNWSPRTNTTQRVTWPKPVPDSANRGRAVSEHSLLL